MRKHRLVGFDKARRACPAVGALVVSALAVGCTVGTEKFEIRHRAQMYNAGALERDYKEEHDYIRQRRAALSEPTVVLKEYWPECPDERQCAQKRQMLLDRVPADGLPRDLTGLAFSGGGIRSASFSLGVLQGLDVQHVLPKVDYMSAVSGGAYMAGWVQAHLGGKQHDFYRDDVYYKVASTTFHDLLDRSGDNVEHLRTHSGFLNQGGWLEGPKLIWPYLWRWPFNLITDVIVHVKGRINVFHPIAIYYNRIEQTYFRGDPPKVPSIDPPPAKRALTLREVNAEPTPAPDGSVATTPYVIINGNLVNQGCARDGSGECHRQFNFEFTRDFAGSDGLGYVDSRAFDRPVQSVETHDDVPTAVTIDDTGPFRLSHAVAAAGAAFDTEGYFKTIKNEWARTVLDYIASPLNLNLGYETWNFARGYDGPFWTPVDYVRMLTYQRLVDPPTDARWIKITDGGHFENLGVMSLVRRGVACIIAVDAGADPKFEFDDLTILVKRLHDLGLTLDVTPAQLDEVRKTGHTALVVTNDQDRSNVSTILYIKPNANGRDPVTGNPFAGQVAPHLDETGKDEDSKDAISKIAWYRHTHACTEFPHTSTLRQSYDWETFEAYRLLGFQMAKTYLPYDTDLKNCQFAPTR